MKAGIQYRGTSVQYHFTILPVKPTASIAVATEITELLNN